LFKYNFAAFLKSTLPPGDISIVSFISQWTDLFCPTIGGLRYAKLALFTEYKLGELETYNLKDKKKW